MKSVTLAPDVKASLFLTFHLSLDHLLRFGVIENLACNGKLLQLLAPTRNGFIVAICQKGKAKDLGVFGFN